MKIEVPYNGEDASPILSIIDEVWNRLPPTARDKIGEVCDVVVLHGSGIRPTASFNYKTSTISFNGQQLREHSPSGQRGVIAHEYGHAFDYADRLRQLNLDDDALREDLPTAEKMANQHAAAWCFEDDVLKANEEFPSQFGPGS